MESDRTHQYAKPPITEAVIQIVFAPDLSGAEVRRASDALSRFYPGVQEYRLLALTEVAPNATLQLKDEPLRFRRATDDQQEVAIISNEYLVVSALAPYKGWKSFIVRFERDFEVLRHSIGARKISRVSMRYINRIDVPFVSLPDMVPDGKYVRVWIQAPQVFGAYINYTVQARYLSPNIGCEVSLNSSVQPSPVPEHLGFTLDIDLLRSNDVPQRIDRLVQLLGEMRLEKNRLFEASITDDARELFN